MGAIETGRRRRAFTLVPLLIAGSGLAMLLTPEEGASKKRWGADYFPNVELVTHEGKTVRFYDDVIKGKVVAINFIFTSCPDVCSGETARLRQVQKLLGPRVGDDIFMYSITIDPETDTPEVLAEYRERFRVGPGWQFLTGRDEDIDLLQRKLGLLIEDLPDPKDHNVSLIVGNESTGRWMKRTPYDSAAVLARLLGDSLHNWKVKSTEHKVSYAEAAKLPSFTRGEYLFGTRCSACHTIGEGDSEGLGPDLFGVVEKRGREWVARWLDDPDVLLKEKDPVALELYAQYRELRMPDFDLSDLEVNSLIHYMETASRHIAKARRAEAAPGHETHQPSHGAHDPHAHH